MNKLETIAREAMRTDIPEFAPGDTVKVMVRVREGDKERLQAFEGVCVARRGGGISENFTVRKVSASVGVERIFPLHTPSVQKVEIKRSGRVRQARLYYLRDRSGKATRLREIIQGRPGGKKRRRRRGLAESPEAPVESAPTEAVVPESVEPTSGNE